MSRVGFHVFSADDGAPALEIARHTPPDVAIIDFNMPTPGLDVVKQLKALHGPAIYVAVLSGHDDEETRTACFAAGADDVLSKPANMTELKRRMVAAARTQQARVESRLARERVDRLLAYGAQASAMLVHDLDTGLAVALSNLLSLHGELRLGEDEARALTSAVQALRRMSGLVANFVGIARFEDAAVKPRTSTTHVRDLLQGVVRLHAAVPASPVRFEVDCDPELVGIFDPALIERVLHNLIGNALRHCGIDGVIRLSARPWDPLSSSGVELAVFHTGPQIPESLRDGLFGKSAEDGRLERGFDLYFCRLACEAHGGTISYRPTEGGPTFQVRLPGRT